MKTTKRKVVKFGQSINMGQFRIEFIKTNHSIVDAAALAIYSPAGVVVHTGDFKVDYTPVFGDAIDLQRFAEIGKKGVLALMCDSTNAERAGFTPSEKTVGKTLDSLFLEHKDTRILIATFALGRIHTYQDFVGSYELARKVGFDNISLDLISSIPGQTLQDWKKELETATAQKPEHISVYQLIIEEGTPFYEKYAEHPELLPDEETSREIYLWTGKFLKEAGYAPTIFRSSLTLFKSYSSFSSSSPDSASRQGYHLWVQLHMKMKMGNNIP